MIIEIDSQNEGKTIKELLRRDMGFSSGMLKKLKFTEGGITVNDSFVTVRYELKKGDVLKLLDEDTEEDTCPYMIPVNLPLSLAYEDDWLTVVNKPHAMPAHPSHGHRLDTVANALAYRYKNAPYVFRPVNRLDSDTSGLMITANSRLSASKMYSSMINGDIVKFYLAVLSKAPEKSEGEINLYMNRCSDSIITRRVCSPDEPGAADALTVYKTLYTNEKGHCFVICSPVTGRTHQLRVHFKAVGCTLLGDSLYGGDTTEISRQALHAAYLSFPHPKSGERITLSSTLPQDIAALCDDPKDMEKSLFSAAEELFETVHKLKK